MLIFAMHQKQKIPVKYYFTGIFFVLQFFPAERQALELILSQNIIKPQTTDNQVQITTQSKTKCF